MLGPRPQQATLHHPGTNPQKAQLRHTLAVGSAVPWSLASSLENQPQQLWLPTVPGRVDPRMVEDGAQMPGKQPRLA